MNKPQYFINAELHLGLQEVRDAKILNSYLKKYAAWPYNVSSTPWCAGFVNACLGQAGIKGTGSFMARSFMKWGQKVNPQDVQLGDIVVFTRGTGSSGHVAFYVNDIDSTHINVLGGNQSDKVCEKPHNKLTILGYRRPL